MTSSPQNHREMEAFELHPEFLGQLIAAHTSGLRDAKPVQDDYDLAEKVIEMLDTRYDGFPIQKFTELFTSTAGTGLFNETIQELLATESKRLEETAWKICAGYGLTMAHFLGSWVLEKEFKEESAIYMEPALDFNETKIIYDPGYTYRFRQMTEEELAKTKDMPLDPKPWVYALLGGDPETWVREAKQEIVGFLLQPRAGYNQVLSAYK